MYRLIYWKSSLALPCLVFLLTPQFSDGVKLQLTPSPIHTRLPENKMYFYQQVIHLCLELVCLSLSCRFFPSSILTPQLPDSPPKPLINGKKPEQEGQEEQVTLHFLSVTWAL